MATMRWLAIVFLVIGTAIAVGFSVVWLLGWPLGPILPRPVRSAGALLAFAGVALAAWTFRHHPARLMARVTARTIEIATRKLPPGSTAVPRLITSGPYQHVRNPTYLSVLLILEGAGLAIPATGLLLAGGLLLVWWNLVVIPPEERELSARFGEGYERYLARTRRFLPTFRRGGGA